MSGARTADLLRGTRPDAGTRPRARGTPGHRTELGAQPLVRDFEAGPFPHQAVAPFPAGAVELLERRTGHRFDPQLLAEWERVRAFVGYEPFVLTPELQAAQRLGDFREWPPALAPELPAQAAHRATLPKIHAPDVPGRLAMPSAEDLGDD